MPKRDMPAAYYREKHKHQPEWEQCDEYLEKPSERLLKWLKRNGFEHGVPERTKTRAGIWIDIKRRQLQEEAGGWRRNVFYELRSWKEPRLTSAVAREISWRLIETKMLDIEPEQQELREMTLPMDDIKAEDLQVEGMEFLPEWMRWVVLYPALMLTREQAREDAVVTGRCDKYEEMFPCPNQAAKNMLELYRGDKKLLDNFFKECAKLHLDAVKRTKTKEGDDNSEEAEAIGSLASLLGMDT